MTKKKPKWWNDYQRGKWIKLGNKDISIIRGITLWVCTEHMAPELFPEMLFKNKHYITTNMYVEGYTNWKRVSHFKKFVSPKFPKGFK